ncbi:MAG: endonuclease/exonuclease/phosphatase family protein [Rhodobacter sp.]|nr:endonuclease/exonuclease/phosphatase family protein [Rhodobacter sp.]
MKSGLRCSAPGSDVASRLAWLPVWIWAGAAAAEPLRVATFHAELSRDGPGLLLRDILRSDPQVEAAAQVIAHADPDVLVLLGIDYDYGLAALGAFADRVAAAGTVYPHRFALRPNTGRATGLDMDGDGRRGGPRDAQGYGRFAGEGGMAVLSRLPIDPAGVRDFSGLLWRDLPGAILPDGMAPEVREAQRLSTTGHWEVPVRLAGGGTLRLLAWHASPPVFDGPEDRNGRRNHDEAALWLRLLDGTLPDAPPTPPFVILGDANMDPDRSEGRPAALRLLLAHPGLQDPRPEGAGGLATADFPEAGGPGRMRADYVLPSAGLSVRASGVVWPQDGDPLLPVVQAASRHRLVWVDIETD